MAWKLVKAQTQRRPKRWLFVLVAGVLLIVVVSWSVYGTSMLGVDKVDVSGATFTSVDKVRDTAKVDKGAALAALDADEIAGRVAQLPSVESVEVSRSWPHTIVIKITERSPFLAVPDGKKFVLVDKFGVAYRTVSEAPKATVTAVLDKPGRQDPATAATLTVLSALTPKLEKALVKVEAKSATQVTLKLKDSRTVFWGDATDSDRKAKVSTALLSRSGKHFDVSAPDVPTVS